MFEKLRIRKNAPTRSEYLDELFIKTSLLTKDAKVLAFFGIQQGDGASTIAAHFAKASNQIERTVLVEASAGGSLANLFGVDGTCGLSDYLGAQMPLGDIVCTTDGLDLICFGNAQLEITQFLNGRFAALLEELAEKYDKIILDLPPVQTHAEALALAGQADAAVLILRHNIKRPVVIRALHALETAKVNLIGSVINKKNRYG